MDDFVELGLYGNWEPSDDPLQGDPLIEQKANYYNVARILRKRGGPRGRDWFIIGQYVMDAEVTPFQQVAELAWRAQDYEDSPPFGDHESMLRWDTSQAAREALKRTAKKILRDDRGSRFS